MKKILFLLALSLSWNSYSQETKEGNPDQILQKGLEAYRSGNFNLALELSSRGLNLAPQYHDLRLLRLRSNRVLANLPAVWEDLSVFLATAPDYPGVRTVGLQYLQSPQQVVPQKELLKKLESVYSGDPNFEVAKAVVLLTLDLKKAARDQASEFISRPELNEEQRQVLRNILRKTVQDELGLRYSYQDLSQHYPNDGSWHSGSIEYQHNFGETAVIARGTFADRGYASAKMVELEAYPILSDNFYSFVNLGISDGSSFFPDFGGSFSLNSSLGSSFEAEAGVRIKSADKNFYTTAILGLTAYTGKFYFNLRSFLGPRTMEKLVKNFRFTTRLYFAGPDQYIYGSIANGLAPDQLILKNQVLENPFLDVWSGNLGIHKSFGIHHLFQLSAGYLIEELSSSREASRFIGGVGYRYRF